MCVIRYLYVVFAYWLYWLSLWSKVQVTFIWSNWCHCHPIISAAVKSRRVYPLVLAYPDHRGKGHEMSVVFMMIHEWQKPTLKSALCINWTPILSWLWMHSVDDSQRWTVRYRLENVQTSQVNSSWNIWQSSSTGCLSRSLQYTACYIAQGLWDGLLTVHCAC